MSTNLPLIAAIAVIAVTVLLLLCGWKWKSDPTRWSFLKDLLVPSLAPLAVAVLGIVFAYQQGKQQAAEAERQQQRSAIRDAMFSQDRADASYLIAVDAQLATHLVRYIALTNNPSRDFDEEGIFFYYGLHRAKLSNLSAAKGGLVFPREWISDAFNRFADSVITNILGGVETDPNVSALGEAVMYRYFGAAASDSRETKSGPLLMEFHEFLAQTNRSDPEERALCEEFARFKDRLETGGIRTNQLLDDISAMIGLVGFSYNDLFAEWTTTEEAPAAPEPSRPPRRFLENFQGCPDYGTNVWKQICSLENAQIQK